MVENSVMLRLKELEFLENIVGKVTELTIYNDTKKSCNSLMRLQNLKGK